MKMPRSTKPTREVFLRCEDHGRGEGFLVCLCVIEGEPVKHVQLPADSVFGIGEILCSRSKIHPQSKLFLMCEGCVREHGWLNRKPRIVQQLRQAVVA